MRGKAISRGGEIFPKPAICRKPGYEERYDRLLQENKLFFTLDIIKEKLSLAYGMSSEERIRQEISDIMDICEATKNSHFLWFLRLLERHFDGIVDLSRIQNLYGQA